MKNNSLIGMTILGLILSLLWNRFVPQVHANENEDSYRPFTVSCTIFSASFPGVPNVFQYPEKSVVLSADNVHKGGYQIIDTIGDYEFSIKTSATLHHNGHAEIFTYDAEIKNLKTGLSARAVSGEDVMSVGLNALKVANVSFQIYTSNSKDASSTLSMNCMHHKTVSGEELMFSH